MEPCNLNTTAVNQFVGASCEGDEEAPLVPMIRLGGAALTNRAVGRDTSGFIGTEMRSANEGRTVCCHLPGGAVGALKCGTFGAVSGALLGIYSALANQVFDDDFAVDIQTTVFFNGLIYALVGGLGGAVTGAVGGVECSYGTT